MGNFCISLDKPYFTGQKIQFLLATLYILANNYEGLRDVIFMLAVLEMSKSIENIVSELIIL